MTICDKWIKQKKLYAKETTNVYEKYSIYYYLRYILDVSNTEKTSIPFPFKLNGI